ncbi:MAG: HAD family hydrolase [Actinomycetota bacterium]
MTKASTLEVFAQSRGISPSKVIAFGDMPNDVEMPRWAGRGYAMHGGHAEALTAAERLLTHPTPRPARPPSSPGP